MRTILIIVFSFHIALTTQAQDIAGDWYGTIKAGNNTIQFVFHIEKAEGELVATMDIPGRNLKGIKTKKTTFDKNELHIDGKNFGFEYFGTYLPDSKVIEGKFKEGVNEMPLNLSGEKPKESVVRKRPQEPQKPYPYREEEVTFSNVEAGVQLAGTLTLPQEGGKFPVAILITGSGPQNRDEEIYGHKPFLVLADHLTRLGIAVLRYDDRGVNQSTGNFKDATTEDFATDIKSAIDYLKTREDIDPAQIGLIGHSEGGIIAPMVAVNSPDDVAFVVLLAGTGVSGYETSRIQATTMRGVAVPDEAAFNDFIIGALDIASSDKDIKSVRTELSTFYLNSPFFNASIPQGVDKETVLKSLIEARTNKWIRYFYHYNPADMLEKVQCPVLSLNGSKDVQVVAKVNQKGIREALEKAGNPDFIVKELPGLNHFFQEAETGMMNEYSQISQTFAHSALEEISSWVLARVKRSK